MIKVNDISRKVLLIFFLFVLLVRCPSLFAQIDSTQTQKRLIDIINASLGTLDQVEDKLERRLIGEVHIKDGNTAIFCDSAIHYISDGRIEAFGNILIQDGNQTIYADQMIYELNSDQSEFFGRVLISDDSSMVLSSELKYFKNSDQLIFPEPFQLLGDSSYLFAESGIYYKEADSAVVFGNVLSLFSEGLLSADSLIYSKKNSRLKAYNRVFFEDEDKLNRLNADSLFVQSDTLREAYGRVHIIQIDSTENDTTHIFSDEVIIKRFKLPSDSTQEAIYAYGNIKQWSTDLSVTADTLLINRTNDTLVWKGNPYLWRDQDQLNASSLTLSLKQKKADKLAAKGSAFNINPDSITNRFNQLKATYIDLNFDRDNEKLKSIIASEQAEAIYQSTNNEDQPDGLLKLASTSIEVLMDKQGNVQDVKSFKDVIGSYFEETDELRKLTLDGFTYLIEKKPIHPENIPQSDQIPFRYSPLFSLPTDRKLTDFSINQWNTYYNFLYEKANQPILISPKD